MWLVLHHKPRDGTNFAFVPIVTMKPRREVGIYKHCRTNKCAMICQEQQAKEKVFVSWSSEG